MEVLWWRGKQRAKTTGRQARSMASHVRKEGGHRNENARTLLNHARAHTLQTRPKPSDCAACGRPHEYAGNSSNRQKVHGDDVGIHAADMSDLHTATTRRRVLTRTRPHPPDTPHASPKNRKVHSRPPRALHCPGWMMRARSQGALRHSSLCALACNQDTSHSRIHCSQIRTS